MQGEIVDDNAILTGNESGAERLETVRAAFQTLLLEVVAR